MNSSIFDQVTTQGDGGSKPKVWSPNQQAIFEACGGDENLLLQAVAGSGKTTTIIKGMMYAKGTSKFLAFNKAIAMDIQSKLECGSAQTFNALGWRMYVDNVPGSEMDFKKLDKILAYQHGEDSPLVREFGYTIKRMVGIAKAAGIGIGDPATHGDFEAITSAFQFDVDLVNIETVSKMALDLFKASVEEMDTFDFDDQLYAPVYHRWAHPRFDNVFVDEAQDLSMIQHLMLERMNSRIIAVGDRHQAIYGFRGAASDSMDLLRAHFSMRELPLDITYRCDIAIVEEALHYCSSIRARPDAGQGSVVLRGAEHDFDPTLFQDALIMCRNNAPLFRAILRHVRAKAPCRVLSNFLEGFTGFIRGFRAKDTTTLRTKLDSWYDKESTAARTKSQWGKLSAIEDKYETATLLADSYSTTEEIIKVVKRMGEGTSGPTFATIHKAKGLEHENAYILRPDLMPAKYARTKEALQQESNMTYVAITRAKRSLTYGVSK